MSSLPLVQLWGAPTTDSDSSTWLNLDQRIREEARQNGVERPRTHTVSFHYNSDVELHHFGRHHPMKPWRLHLTKQLVLSYGLQYAMDVYQTREATKQEMAEFHKDDYLDFLSQITPENADQQDPMALHDYNFGDDCPIFDGLYEYCKIYTGATMSAARNLTSDLSDIAINWSGGLHHAHKGQASGFCYINDIVLAILELLRVHPRVLYVDIDVHHGDGVEAAFASTDRVCTLSYHKFEPGQYFPGTGGIDETGPTNPRNPGAHHSLNVPLMDGIDDDQYTRLFRDITGATIEAFRPTAIVLQCGADSLGGDRLGKFNLNIRAHGECVSFLKSQRLPLLLLGGGGYTARNVARLWCHETSLCADVRLNDTLPEHVPYRQAFIGVENGSGLLYPDLHNIEGKHHRNEHTPRYLADLVVRIKEQLRYMKGAPSVMMREVPRDVWALRDEIAREMADETEGGRREKERGIGVRGELI